VFTLEFIIGRFEESYQNFLNCSIVLEPFTMMAEIRNVLAISEMTDHAFLLKLQSATHASDFLLSRSAGQSPEELELNSLEWSIMNCKRLGLILLI
jgi:hypothetical protein